MTKIIVDTPFEAKVHDLCSAAEICDSSGRMLGHFVPLQTSIQTQAAIEECPYSEEALEAMQRETGGQTLPKIWEKLERG